MRDETSESQARLIRHRKSRIKGLLIAGVVAATTLSVLYNTRGRMAQPHEGGIYIRTGLDSVLVASLVLGDTAATATPLARRLVMHLLTHDVRVQIDHVGGCGDLMRRYAAFNANLRRNARDALEAEFRTRRPVMLAASERDKCFSYTVKYDVPLGRPMRRGGDLLVQVPVRLALIHPLVDFQQFHKE